MAKNGYICHMKPCDSHIHHITLAFDSFKGSLRSDEVADIFEEGLRTVLPHCMVRKVRIADGGEGTLDALMSALGGEHVTTDVCDPLGRLIWARYGITTDKTAIIEMARASGLTLLRPEELNPMLTDTYGTGQLIAHALDKGCRRFILCIGGSATNDCGIGMLRALGYRFFDSNGKEMIGGGGVLQEIHHIDDSHVIPSLAESRFTVACDVDNPLFGPNGATHVFAPQKGATPDMVVALDNGLQHFATVMQRYTGEDISSFPGAGAAGGLAAALKGFLHAQFERGIDMVLQAIRFADLINGCDLVVTGEGKLDRQTTMGKAPMGILRAAQSQGIPVIAVGGTIEQCPELETCGFYAILCANDAQQPLHIAMQRNTALYNLRRAGIRVGQLLMK